MAAFLWCVCARARLRMLFSAIWVMISTAAAVAVAEIDPVADCGTYP